MSVASARGPQQDQTRGLTVAAGLLSELQAAYTSLLASMREMERLTRPPPKSAQELTAARFRLSNVSLFRRVLIEKVCEFLRPRVGDEDAKALRSLAQARFDYLLRSTAHVSRWSLDQVAQDWGGYCAASREIRRHLAQSIEAEQSVLYAMLQRYWNS